MELPQYSNICFTWKVTMFSVVTPCSSEKAELNFPPASAGTILGLHFDPEDRSNYVPLKHIALSKLHSITSPDDCTPHSHQHDSLKSNICLTLSTVWDISHMHNILGSDSPSDCRSIGCRYTDRFISTGWFPLLPGMVYLTSEASTRLCKGTESVSEEAALTGHNLSPPVIW
jgi:hypothetical protein